MKFSKESHLVQAIIIAGIVVALLLIIILLLLIRRATEQHFLSLSDQEFSIFLTKTDKPLSSDAVATLGQAYIKKLSAYDLEQNNPILLIDVEFLEQRLWLARYKVDQVYDGMIQIYYFSLEIRDARVVGHDIVVSNKEGSSLVFNPEPEQIISGDKLIVKGQIFEDYQDIKLQISEIASSALVYTSTFNPIEQEEIYIFSIDRPENANGELILKLNINNTEISVPFVWSPEVKSLNL